MHGRLSTATRCSATPRAPRSRALSSQAAAKPTRHLQTTRSNMLHCVSPRSNLEYCVAPCCNMSYSVAPCHNMLYCVALCRNVLYCVALCRNVFYCVALCRNSAVLRQIRLGTCETAAPHLSGEYVHAMGACTAE